MNAEEFLNAKTFMNAKELECYDLVNEIEKEMSPQLLKTDEIAEFNQLKVLNAMQENRLCEAHFSPTNGYGYNDIGREALEDIYATIFKAEAALVRPQVVSGTHALTCALFGNLRPGDTLMYVTGAPYDTLHGVIGIKPEKGSLAEFGVNYRQVDLLPDGSFDYESIAIALKNGEQPNGQNGKSQPTTQKPIKMVGIQRSKGYAWRPSYTVAQIGELIKFIKDISPDTICMVDNCYGEFVEHAEPVEVGADMAVGSLFKNPGGGLAPVGGYVAGGLEYVEGAATRLTAPGLGREVGPTLGITSNLLLGLFLAPQVVSGSVRGAILASAAFDRLGYPTSPGPMDPRADIVQAIKLGSAEKVLAYCRGIQRAAPVDSFVTPEGSPMPGYDHEVIMAAGAFVQGSTMELSADGPLKEPFIVFMQGGLTRYHAKIGVVYALSEIGGR